MGAALVAVLAACEQQDKDRLRDRSGDELHSPIRDRLRDGLAPALPTGVT